MSGIEVAGLVLGAFPLFISALEHYKEAAEMFEDWWQIKKEYKKCKNEIKLQELAFENNLERFLLPLVIDDEEIEALIAEPGGPKWLDAVLEEKLRDRLPRSYDLFLDTMTGIQNTMAKLGEELGVGRVAFQEEVEIKPDKEQIRKQKGRFRDLFSRSDSKQRVEGLDPRRNMKMKWLSRPNFEFQTQRVKFGFGRATREKLFEELGRYNSRLRELLDTSDKSAFLKESRERAKVHLVSKLIWKLWRHASSLHSLLDQAWCCQCKHLHQTRLLLHHQTNVEDISYGICFYYRSGSAIGSTPWTWQSTNAQQVNLNVKRHFITSRTPNIPTPPPLAQTRDLKSSMRASKHPRLPARSKVNFTDLSLSSTSAATPSPSFSAQDEVIGDLCASIACYDPAKTCLGLLQGDEEAYILQRGHETNRDESDCVSLKSLLDGTAGLKLDRRQRYTVAFTVASTHLQLYPSPWLQSHWSKEDILFPKDLQNPNSVLIDRPYLSRNCGSPETTMAETRYATSDRTLQTLGIILIELCFGSTLEQHDLRQQYDKTAQGNTSSDLAAALDLAVALQWAYSVGGEAGESYADAVQWCLRPQSNAPKDDKWREELFANVVIPLQSCHEQLSPKA